MRLLLILSIGAALFLVAESIPMEVIRALVSAHHPPPKTTPRPPLEAHEDDDRSDDAKQDESKKGLLTRVYKTKVINLPSRGLQVVLLPWKCYKQSSCERTPKCVPSSSAGGKTVCTIKCYACNSCMQPKIVRRKLKNGKISETRKSYIRTHRCGLCYSRSECDKAPCPAPKPCTRHSKKRG